MAATRPPVRPWATAPFLVASDEADLAADSVAEAKFSVIDLADSTIDFEAASAADSPDWAPAEASDDCLDISDSASSDADDNDEAAEAEAACSDDWALLSSVVVVSVTEEAAVAMAAR